MALNRSHEPKPAAATSAFADAPVLVPAIARLGLPVGLFGATFFVVAFALTMLFSPDRFPVRVGDKTVRLSDLEAEEKSLKTKQGNLLEERRSILADSDAPVLRQVEKLRGETSPIGAAMLAIEDIRKSFKTPNSDPIALPGVQYDHEKNALTIEGDVRDQSGRSMQILATFVDELRAHAIFESVSEPEYESEPLKEGGTRSPFILTLRFPHE